MFLTGDTKGTERSTGMGLDFVAHNKIQPQFFFVFFVSFVRVCRGGFLILAWLWGMLGTMSAAELYYTNRVVTSVTFALPPDPPVELLISESARLTEVVNGEPVRLNSNDTYALEREAFTVGYLSAIDAWDDAVVYYTNAASLNHQGKIFDNVGWVRGASLARGEWGAYLWTMQNRIAFYSSVANFWQATDDGIPVKIKNVIVGSLGIYAPLAYVVDIGPRLDAATNNFPAQAEAREFYADITNVFYEVVIPEIWLRPKQAYAPVGGSNVQFIVTGTNIPQGVTWLIYPADFAGHARFSATTTNSAWVTPGTVATNYKIRATSKDNTNFYDEVDLAVVKVEIEETAPNNGFDDTVDPPWLVVPANNPPNQNTVKANIDPSLAAAQVYFTIDDTGKATVSPVQASTSPQTLTLTGVAKGHTALRVRVGSTSGPVCKTLNVCVRGRRIVNVDFHYMQDNAGHGTTRATNTANSFITTMNDIWMIQANLVFSKGAVDSPTVPTNLGSVVEWYPTNPSNEWDDVVSFRNGDAPDVYLVWEYEQDRNPATDVDMAQLGGDILMEDSAGAEVGETLAHEMGHYFGISPADYTDNQDQLMHAYTDVRGQKITHAQVDQVPQP